MSEELSRAQIKVQVSERALGCCEYCKSPIRFATDSMSVEHILPVSKGGTDSLDNLALSCQGCNNHKFTKTSGIDRETGQQVPLFNPRTQQWTEHFRWSADYTQVIGLTASGRVTVEELNLNRDGLVNLRRVLYLAGEHPEIRSASPDTDTPPEGEGVE